MEPIKPDKTINSSHINGNYVSESTTVYVPENTAAFDFDSFIASLPVIDLSSENAVFPGSANDWDW